MALWRSSKRSGLIRRQSKVRVLPASLLASSSNGQDACFSHRERGFDSRRGYQMKLKMENAELKARYANFQFTTPL
jgi:hypothetical protein